MHVDGVFYGGDRLSRVFDANVFYPHRVSGRERERAFGIMHTAWTIENAGVWNGICCRWCHAFQMFCCYSPTWSRNVVMTNGTYDVRSQQWARDRGRESLWICRLIADAVVLRTPFSATGEKLALHTIYARTLRTEERSVQDEHMFLE